MNSPVQNLHFNYIKIKANISNKIATQIKKSTAQTDGTFDTVKKME